MTNTGNNKKHRITLFLNADLAKHAKAEAVIQDLSLTNLVEKALIRYLPDETKIRKPDIKVAFDP